MSGNVWEWLGIVYGDHSTSVVSNPTAFGRQPGQSGQLLAELLIARVADQTGTPWNAFNLFGARSEVRWSNKRLFPKPWRDFGSPQHSGWLLRVR